jgi:uncharacterized protein
MTTDTAYLEGPTLRDALLTACRQVQHARAELNRINVFPVPDGDTGTNFSLTVRSIADRLRASRADSVATVMREAAEASILGARGNCGMILSHFLLGFAEQVGTRARLSIAEFAVALRGAVDHVYRSLERPVEGTILTVMREAADEAARSTATTFAELFRQILERARAALERTPDLLPVLRAAGVVDAGAKGFVHWLEGIAAYLGGDPLVGAEAPLEGATPDFEATDAAAAPIAAALADYPGESERYRFCTEALVRGAALPSSDALRATLRERGDSLVVIRSGEVLKVHIHTDEPEDVFAYLRGLGELVTHKAEDMRLQHEALVRGGHVRLARRPVALLTDSACDLPAETILAHGITVVPLNLIFGDETLRDGVEITSAEFTERLLQGAHPTTSQPAPAAFLDGYREAAETGEEIVAVVLSAALSGTYASAEAAARHWRAGAAEATARETPIHLVDSRGATLVQGLLVLKGAELAEQGWEPRRIAGELTRIRDQSGVFFTVDTFDRLLASGRVGRGRAFIGSLLDIKPILGLSDDGRIQPISRVRGMKNVLPKMLDELEKRIPAGAQRLRFGVVHVACPQVLDEICDVLRVRFPGAEILTGPASPVLATHMGPGAWGLAYQVED